MTNIPKININIVLVVSAIILLYSCSEPQVKNQKVKKLIDFEILYLYQGNSKVSNDKYRFRFKEDSIYFMFESNFKNCQIELVKNDNSILYRGKVTTEPSSGLADVVVTKNTPEINRIGIRVDSSPQITFEIVKKEDNIIGVRKKKSKLQIVFYKKAPLYY